MTTKSNKPVTVVDDKVTGGTYFCSNVTFLSDFVDGIKHLTKSVLQQLHII